MTLLTQAQYARRLGLSRAAIGQWKLAGHLVMQGDLVDVEASDAWQQRYRRAGLPCVRTKGIMVKRGRPPSPTCVDLATLEALLPEAQPMPLPCVEIERRLAALDWKSTFAWSDEAIHTRVRLAAHCAGLEAIESALRDDGHWGGYQVRSPSIIKEEGFREGVLAGYGFDLLPFEVLRFCRTQVERCRDENGAPIFDDDTEQVIPELLVLLAHPHSEDERPCG